MSLFCIIFRWLITVIIRQTTRQGRILLLFLLRSALRRNRSLYEPQVAEACVCFVSRVKANIHSLLSDASFLFFSCRTSRKYNLPSLLQVVLHLTKHSDGQWRVSGPSATSKGVGFTFSRMQWKTIMDHLVIHLNWELADEKGGRRSSRCARLTARGSGVQSLVIPMFSQCLIRFSSATFGFSHCRSPNFAHICDTKKHCPPDHYMVMNLVFLTVPGMGGGSARTALYIKCLFEFLNIFFTN